jgi:hypothetical protein
LLLLAALELFLNLSVSLALLRIHSDGTPPDQFVSSTTPSIAWLAAILPADLALNPALA